MKIVHLCLAGFFPDGYSYQENMLPKYHKALGYEVAVIASLVTFDENGRTAYLKEARRYENEHGVMVTRLNYRGPLRFARKMRTYQGVYQAIERENPDVLFMHGCQFLDISQVVRYMKRHPGVRLYVDNHADFSNSATNFLSRNLLHRLVWRRCAHKILPYARKFYGVLPARVDFLRNVYGLPQDKTELLVMGADDEAVRRSADLDRRERVRARYGVGAPDFLIVTGGKIDAFKTQTLLLMEAVKRLRRENLKLIVFGSVIPELKERLTQLADGRQIQYVGWVASEDTYDLIAAADLCCFPGRHSVLWEQACGQGVPLIVKEWPGTTHVDAGGNALFLTRDSAEEIERAISRVLDEPGLYQDMLEVARGAGMKRFSYRDIARRSIEEEN